MFGWVCLAQSGPSRWPLVSLALGLVGVGTLISERKRAGVLVLLVMTVPFALNLLMGLAGPSRVYAFATPFLVLSVARGVTAVPQLVRRIKPGPGTSIFPLVIVGTIAVAGYVPAAQDGPTDTGYRQFGKMITEEVGDGDLVVAPYIMDSSLGYYTQGLLLKQVREVIVEEEGSQRLLVATRVGDVPRFSLADYMLTTNFTTAEGGHADRYRNYEFPEDAFRVVRQTGNLRLFEALARPRAAISDPRRLAAEFWHVYYESHPNTTKISSSVDGGYGTRIPGADKRG